MAAQHLQRPSLIQPADTLADHSRGLALRLGDGVAAYADQHDDGS